MDIHSVHAVLVGLHAASAVMSLLAGCFLLFSLGHLANRRLFGLYWWFLVGMVAALACAMVVYWTQYANTERVIFTSLFVLGLFMLYRARSASQLLKSQAIGWQRDYIEHIGFTLISLFEGFIIVTLLNSGSPGWLVALVAVLGVLMGRWVIGLAQRRAGTDLPKPWIPADGEP